MANLKERKKKLRKLILYKVFLFLASVAILSYFIPRDNKFNYEFNIKKPWKYNQLIATFDFPIYKDDKVIKQEQDSIIASFKPYYNLESEISKREMNRFKNDFQKSLVKSLRSKKNYKTISKELEKIYTSGIINLKDKNDHQTIMVINKNIAQSKPTAELYTPKKAYQQLLKICDVDKKSLAKCNLNKYLTPNLVYDSLKTAKAKKDLLNNYSWANGMVVSGQKIIDQGEIITPKTYNILKSLEKELIKRNDSTDKKNFVLIGQILFISILFSALFFYLELFRKDIYKKKKNILLLLTLIIFYSVITYLMASNKIFNIYIIPYAMLPIIIRIFFDSRTAFFCHTITILLCSIALKVPYEFVLLQFLAGIVAIFSLKELSQRSQLFKTTFFIALTYTITFLAYELIIENDITKLNINMYVYFVINGIFLLFTYPLLFLFEKIFGFTSNVTLVELSNINNKLLRELSEKAPGTFQHSMQVANLAAEVAIQIGAKSQLVRTGALYHDIGKMLNPAFFTENQSSGINPHEKISYQQSARIVINHVKDGLRLADKYDLPSSIKNFISTHHGKGYTKYFYILWKKENPDNEEGNKTFQYPGPNPSSKETGILMMADAVEAASRSLNEYTEENISNLVDKIIDAQVNEGYFKQCPITFRDIDTAKRIFKEKLKITYHTRISYPELKN